MVSLNFGLRLEQSQKLIMTPELRQAIKILQLSSLELTDYLQEAIIENPLIDVKEDSSILQEKKANEIDWESYFQANAENRSRLKSQSEDKGEKNDFVFENVITKETSLHEYLLSQLGLIPIPEQEKKVAKYLIGNIDRCGYLSVSIEQAQRDLSVEENVILRILSIIQNFDPSGVGARDLSECLRIQLDQKGYHDPLLYVLVDNHLQDIAYGRLTKIAQVLNLHVTDVQDLADIVRTLNPKPGAAFGYGDEIRYVVPDVTVERIDGEYVILVNDTNVPRLTINKTYRAILNKESNVDDKTKDFVENKLNQAVWLLKSIEQRRATIYQVSEELVKMQKDFFDKGTKYLKPLNLKQIAERVGVHESTVSRATANKYIQTPHGIFEFKFFFTAGLQTNSGENTSSECIKQQLQDIIKGENETKPYSDQKISDIFKSRGVMIARRTIAKYREEIGIPNAGQRKRYT